MKNCVPYAELEMTGEQVVVTYFKTLNLHLVRATGSKPKCELGLEEYKELRQLSRHSD
jgi:hypothetical protein